MLVDNAQCEFFHFFFFCNFISVFYEIRKKVLGYRKVALNDITPLFSSKVDSLAVRFCDGSNYL